MIPIYICVRVYKKMEEDGPQLQIAAAGGVEWLRISAWSWCRRAQRALQLSPSALQHAATPAAVQTAPSRIRQVCLSVHATRTGAGNVLCVQSENFCLGTAAMCFSLLSKKQRFKLDQRKAAPLFSECRDLGALKQ